MGINSCGRSKHSDCLFDHGYLEEEKSIIHSFTVTFGAKYLTGMVTSVPPYETFNLIKNNILHQSKIYKNHFWGMWPLGHVGHVTYSFINMLFISTGIFDDKLRPQILSVDTTENSPLKGKSSTLGRPIISKPEMRPVIIYMCVMDIEFASVYLYFNRVGW